MFPSSLRLRPAVASALIVAALAIAPGTVGARPGERLARVPARAAPAPPSMDATPLPANTAIKIDGDLSEAAWASAPVTSNFIERDPQEGATPTHRTEVRVVYDPAALYVGIRALDPEPQRIVGLLGRRDDQSPSDWVSVLIDSFHDRRTAFEFGVNAAGVRYDRYWFNDTNNDMSWDAVWEVSVKRTADGWQAEFRIPFSQLRFHPAPTSTFGFAIVRMVAHNNETSTWPLLSKAASGYVSSFGDLTGLAIGASQQKLELMPYTVAQVTTQPIAQGDPLNHSPAAAADVGLDLKYKVAPGLLLTGTVNPDFGQVEADPAVVNLSGFETYFAEQRPFFVEGSGNFNFDVDCNNGPCSSLFYSRRIGRPPEVSPTLPSGAFLAEPADSRILGAAKLTGRIGAFSIGGLTAVTGRETARVAADPGTPVTTTPVEPAASFSVLRASREFKNQSRIGFILTNTSRALAPELAGLPRQAFTGGVDVDWRLFHGGYSITGYWAGSGVRGSAAAIDALQTSDVHSFQRPDATYLAYDPRRTQLRGDAGSIVFGKIAGSVLRFNEGVSFKSPGFDINDVGFMQRADTVFQSTWVQLHRSKPRRYVRDFVINFNQYGNWNTGGDVLGWGGNVNAHWVFTNNWSAGTGVNMNAAGFNDRLTRGGPAGLTPGNVNQWFYLNTDDRRRFQFSYFGFWLRDAHRSSDTNGNPSVTWRPSSALMINLGASVDHGVSDAQWVANLTDGTPPHYVFGRLNQVTVWVSARVNYTITPTLTVQIYGRPFVSAGGYSNFRELVDGRAAGYDNRYAAFDYTTDPDFNFRSFRMTNVLRWEYRPGSVLFVVWQQGREDTPVLGDFVFSRDFGGVFRTPSTNVFLIKISKWFGV